ncbi:MAG: hypothetical protein NZZ41_02860 [Candidatus Dojkabacteria bacterium]|nr:hypothetical protein [Candidatus Dojkabacteria bacterium]
MKRIDDSKKLLEYKMQIDYLTIATKYQSALISSIVKAQEV